MLTTIDNLPSFQQEQLAQLIQRIAQAIQPDKIVCYGCRVIYSKDWGCFLENGHHDSTHPTFDLLIITRPDEQRISHDIIQIAEQQCLPPFTISCIAHKLPSVNEAIQAGSHFFSTLFQKGILLYDASGIALQEPESSFTGIYSRSKAQDSWDRWFGQAKRFYSLALHSFSEGWYDQTIFLLHQAVENTCIALIRLYTGYRSNTHNLSRLLAMTENFDLHPTSIFPRITKQETELFNLLLNGYSDTRYKELYAIPAETVSVLLERVQLLQQTAEKLYKERISFYSEKESMQFPLMAV